MKIVIIIVGMHLNGTAKYSKAPAIEDVIDYFVMVDGLSQSSKEVFSDQIEINRHYDNDRKEQVWQVLIKDGRHSWPKEEIYGININALIIDFFDAVSGDI